MQKAAPPLAICMTLDVLGHREKSHPPHRAVARAEHSSPHVPSARARPSSCLLCLPFSQDSEAVRVTCEALEDGHRVSSWTCPSHPWEEERADSSAEHPNRKAEDAQVGSQDAETSASGAPGTAGQATPGFEQPPVGTPVSSTRYLSYVHTGKESHEPTQEQYLL